MAAHLYTLINVSNVTIKTYTLNPAISYFLHKNPACFFALPTEQQNLDMKIPFLCEIVSAQILRASLVSQYNWISIRNFHLSFSLQKSCSLLPVLPFCELDEPELAVSLAPAWFEGAQLLQHRSHPRQLGLACLCAVASTRSCPFVACLSSETLYRKNALHSFDVWAG